MLDELNGAISQYFTKWQAFSSGTEDTEFYSGLKPTAAAWKTEDLSDFIARFDELQASCDQVHLAWLNGRWLAVMHLKDTSLHHGISLVKLMQRRPASTDATGLDHIDFLLPEAIDAKAKLGQEATIQWTEESNGDICKWLSVWFDGGEAKLRSDTVLNVCANELVALEKRIVA